MRSVIINEKIMFSAMRTLMKALHMDAEILKMATPMIWKTVPQVTMSFYVQFQSKQDDLYQISN